MIGEQPEREIEKRQDVSATGTLGRDRAPKTRFQCIPIEVWVILKRIS
jgi:hypothetical protein